jgi:hypothetical protein
LLIVKRFGAPRGGDGYKVSGEYIFLDQGQPFVVHDWKSTKLWDPDLFTPEEFWSSREPMELNISSRDLDTTEFERWFLGQLQVNSG